MESEEAGKTVGKFLKGLEKLKRKTPDREKNDPKVVNTPKESKPTGRGSNQHSSLASNASTP